MKVRIQIAPYAGGVVCTVLSGGYQLGQSRVFGEEQGQAAVEDAIESMLRRILGKEQGATWLPPELEALIPKREGTREG